MKLTIDTVACCGCRTCEMACSFHHRGVFSPECSSIKVTNRWGSGEIQWAVDSTCDSCEGEVGPLCIKYCHYGALAGEMENGEK